ncbi:MAG: hypothetical protein RQ751_12745 [Longimicrobiales bacterium]|nr:hypothetical protein [Longimicrobiales bacterium]
MRTFGTLALGGLAGIAVLKLLSVLLFPMLAFMAGLVGLAVKVALWVAVGYLVYTLLRGRRKSSPEV